MAMKKVLSMVLSDKDARWIKVTEETVIPTNTPLTIRIFNPNIIVNENDEQVVYAEERRIAIYTDEKKWNVCGPFPKYNYSSLVDDEGNLKENVSVSHYEIAKMKDIDAYQHRFDSLIKWKYLDIKIDPTEEESVYKAFTFMQDIIRQYYAFSQFGEPDPNLKMMSELSIGILHDLISIIDTGHHIENEVSEIEKTKIDDMDPDAEVTDDVIKTAQEELKEQDEKIYENLEK